MKKKQLRIFVFALTTICIAGGSLFGQDNLKGAINASGKGVNEARNKLYGMLLRKYKAIE